MRFAGDGLVTRSAGCRASTRCDAVSMRVVHFSELDEGKAISFLQRFPTARFGAKWGKVDAWGDAEWRVFGAARLEFTSQPLPNGVRLCYFMSEATKKKRGLSGLVPDGSLEITVDMGARWFGIGPAAPALRGRSRPGMAAVDDVARARPAAWASGHVVTRHVLHYRRGKQSSSRGRCLAAIGP